MKHVSITFLALLVTCTAATGQKSIGPGSQAPVFDEEATYQFSRPIPIIGTTLGCHVSVYERICRTDKLRITALEVLSKTVAGASELTSVTVDRGGCAFLRATVGVEVSTVPAYKCVGGEPSIDVRLLLKAKGSQPRSP